MTQSIVPPNEVSLDQGLHVKSLKLEEVEKALIFRVLEITGENRTKAAEIMGISRRTLQRKLKKYKTTDKTQTSDIGDQTETVSSNIKTKAAFFNE